MKVRYTFVLGGKPLTVSSLTDIEPNEEKAKLAQSLVAWNQSLRRQALLHIIEQQAGRDTAKRARIQFDSAES